MDIGANLCDDMFQGMYHGKQKHQSDVQAVISRSFQQLKEITVTIGCIADYERFVTHIQPLNEKLTFTVGIHPTNALQYTEAVETQIKQILSQKPKGLKMFGEFGLDYDRIQFAPIDVQIPVFKQQLILAQNSCLPLFLHCRNGEKNAYDDLISILQQYQLENKYKFEGVIHSFDGTLEDAQKILQTQFYIGLNGCSFKSEENLAVAKQIPLDRILTESDCPYCDIRPTHAGFKYLKNPPTGVKPEKWTENCYVKGRNEPNGVVQVIQVLAGLHNKTYDEVYDICWQNAQKLFKIQ
ncbi:Deoxyribonuclease [Hexamita inflata]|uniref:Deoxyribonuclease n=1 Tax=Hexamita inflata TaxID=28002 RepID=A0AA86NJQ7_9EUKA|nr:Deoxyribonuclease [Hexamita inflata]